MHSDAHGAQVIPVNKYPEKNYWLMFPDGVHWISFGNAYKMSACYGHVFFLTTGYLLLPSVF